MVPIAKVLDLLLPPRCVSCQKMVVEHKTLCLDCWEEAKFITAPFCKCCGLPFEIEVAEGAICLHCAKRRPPFKAARTVFPYDDFSRQLVLAFKHGDRTDLAPVFAAWMKRAAPDLIEQSDVIVPVPLHWRRLGKRRYNQAGLLAGELAKMKGIQHQPHLLKRVRHTPPQGLLSRMARQKNLQGAFVASHEVADKSILLIDDVLTTGATVLNCTKVLLQAGARDVRVLTLARVIHKE
ncbi:putative phosphoribosyl transferase [Candidatus Terasakiella magnetica]|uniref:Putative phosphoribosyl transferase n=1 Tax=Candidatus Terasakiella magnetica TaxID=1867952 RepID=A0A1C3RJC8_9PROT|nr:ComF family protein [Candidatus Terasakiella magnetica]SCA57380.1 putative phosphoribosyl transferase [Candidatus Terasakiella magnetica]